MFSPLRDAGPAKRPRVRVSITAFLSLASLALLLVSLGISHKSLNNLDAISHVATELREKSLPEMQEAQRAFINLEGLRRAAEIVYVSEDQFVRRQARINAQALAAETAFFLDQEGHEKAREIAEVITSLARHKSAMEDKNLQQKRMAAIYYDRLQQLLQNRGNSSQAREIFRSFFQSSLSGMNTALSIPRTREQLRALEEQDLELVDKIHGLCRQSPAARDQCMSLENLYSSYVEDRRQILADAHMARFYWENIDTALREMRDIVSTESEITSSEALTAIEDAASKARKSGRKTFAAALAFLAVYILLLHRFITRPILWMGRRLREIQHGDFYGNTPEIRITELHNMSELLDKFSAHLSELYVHTSQLEEDAAEKRDLEEVMAAVFKASLDGYLLWEGDVLRSVSPGFLAFVGVRTQEEFMEHWPRFRMPSLDERRRAFAKAIVHGHYREESTFRTFDGSPLICEVTHLRIDGRDHPLVLSYVRDLRQQKRNEEALRMAKEEAESAAQAKSDFLARMSHEIRTPMNGVLGLTHLALQSAPPQPQRQFLTKIEASAKILLGVINDILDFSKIDSGKMSLHPAPFSYREMIRTVVDLFQSQARDKGLEFVLEEPLPIPDALKGDSLRLSQVLLNLCSNAVKFTARGKVVLRVILEEQTERQVRLMFRVSDTGVGLSEEQLSRLFQPFSQADSSTTRKYGGTGLGLVISKHLVEMMNGHIRVQSEPGQGSTFSFSIALERADEDELLADNAAPAPMLEDLSGLRILVAEDNEINQEIAKALLENLGITVILAGNGQEAVDILEKTDVDGVLMDIQMPVMDGLTATRKIRQEGRARIRSLPILAMTAHAMEEDRLKSLAAGLNDHLTKPIDIAELRAKLLHWVAPARNPLAGYMTTLEDPDLPPAD